MKSSRTRRHLESFQCASFNTRYRRRHAAFRPPTRRAAFRTPILGRNLRRKSIEAVAAAAVRRVRAEALRVTTGGLRAVAARWSCPASTGSGRRTGRGSCCARASCTSRRGRVRPRGRGGYAGSWESSPIGAASFVNTGSRKETIAPHGRRRPSSPVAEVAKAIDDAVAEG